MQKRLRTPLIRLSLFFLISCVLTGLASSISAQGAPDAGLGQLTSAEKFVVSQLSRGDEADLGKIPEHTVRADFLEDLLTGKIDKFLAKKRGVAILNAHIAGELILAQAEVQYAVFLNNCTFEGPVDLSGAHFHHDLSFLGSVFKKATQAGQLKVDGDLTLRSAHFDSDVDFAAVTVAGSLYAIGITSSQQNTEVEFDYAKVGTITDFSDLKLAGPLRLTGADLQVLFIKRESNPNSDTLSAESTDRVGLIDLEGTVVHRDFEIEGKVIETLNAPGLDVLGDAAFQNVTITGEIDLEGSHFDDLSFGDNVTWPQALSSNRLSGITFSRLSPVFSRQCATDPKCVDKRWQWLLDDWVDRAEYSPQAYQQLETALRNAGRSTLSDKTFVKMKERERTEGHLTLGESFFNWIECWVIGYGREPQYAVYWSIPFIVLGYFVFRRKYMRQVKPDDQLLPYNAFWYSFELFLPLVKLQCAELWVPHDNDRARIFYMRFHSMMGWVLVPFALAALTGLVHGK